MARFRLKPTPVEAIQLRWDTWSEMCELIAAPGGLEKGNPEGCYVDQDGNETDDTNGRIGLKIPRPGGVEIAAQDDWIVRMDGGLVVYKPAAFEALFESHADYKVAFDPDWSKYPKLARVFEHRPPVNVYWDDLRALLVDARADAVQYVHDVRAEELTLARTDERKRVLEELKMDWSKMTAREVWDALRSPPKVVGPWEPEHSGDMDVRRAPDGTIIATTLWVTPKHPVAPWRVPVSTSDRDGADTILREHGWLLAE